MPATQVDPALRRRLSDDARALLRSALQETDGLDVQDQSLAERLQNFRGQIRLEVPELGTSIPLRMTVSGTSYLLRYHLESINAEVAVYNKNGASTTWITKADGVNVQLRTFLAASSSPEHECKQIAALIDVVDALDLMDVFRGALIALPVPPLSPTTLTISRHRNLTYRATTDKNSYVYVFDEATGRPLSVTQTALWPVESNSAGPSAAGLPSNSPTFQKLQLVVEEYLRFEGAIDIPDGIKSDVELMIDTAMTCFSQWSYVGQQVVMSIFDTVDKDSDGFVSGQDIYEQLLVAGHTEHQCSNIVLEMSRLLCDTADPAEEFKFYKFCGFWMTMLADGFRVSDPANEAQIVRALQHLFLGAV